MLCIVLAAALAAASCGGDDDTTGSSTSSTTTTAASSTTSSTTTSSTTSSSTTTTTIPEPVCDETEAFAVADDALASARLAAGGDWATDTTGNPFDDRTRLADWMPKHLGLDCGVRAAQTTADGDERLFLAAWTGPRYAFVIQATDQPSTPYSPSTILWIVTEEPYGEMLLDDMSLWAGQLEGGETLVVGHIDYNLGATAKSWHVDVPALPDAEPTLDSERHAIATLRDVGMRNVAVAQPAEFGSEEGTVMFVSPTGQISVVAVAPSGWFDPLLPRGYSGTTTTETISGVKVRVTEPAEGQLPGLGAEIGWSCRNWEWILEPPLNGTIDEMLEIARAVIQSGTC